MPDQDGRPGALEGDAGAPGNRTAKVIAKMVKGAGHVNGPAQAAGESCRLYSNSVLQMLNRWLPDDNGKEKGTYYPLEVFREEAAAFDGVPVVYARTHPDLDKFADPKTRAEALREVGGRIVGKTANPRIEIEGHPKLKIEMTICDKEANALWDAGKLSPSNAFKCVEDKEGRILGRIIPNHVLVFEEDAEKGDMPRDLGSNIMNKQEVEAEALEKEEKNAGREFSRKNVEDIKGLKSVVDGIGKKLDEWLHRAEPKDEEEEEAKTADAGDAKVTSPVKTGDVPFAPVKTPLTNQDAGGDEPKSNAKKGGDSAPPKGKGKASEKKADDDVGEEGCDDGEKDCHDDKKENCDDGKPKSNSRSHDEKIEANTKKEGEVEMDPKELAVLTEKANKADKLAADLEAAQKEIAAINQRKLEEGFEAFLANVKVGMKDTDAKKAELKKLYMEDPRGIVNKAGEIFALTELPSAKEQHQGKAHVPEYQNGTQSSQANGPTLGYPVPGKGWNGL